MIGCGIRVGKRLTSKTSWQLVLGAVLALAGAAFLGFSASLLRLMILVCGLGLMVVLRHPLLGLIGVVVLALLFPVEIGTGTEVTLNPVTLLIPAVTLLWLITMVRRNQIRFAVTSVNVPLVLLLLTGLLSLLLGYVFWDPLVPRSDTFVLVQLAQWVLFAFSAIAVWLTGNMVAEEKELKTLTYTFLSVGGTFAILLLTPGFSSLISNLTTISFIRAPFWLLLSSLCGGQLLFNRNLSLGLRLFLIVTLGAVVVHNFGLQQESASMWIGVLVTFSMLLWLRWPNLRRPLILLLILLLATGTLFSAAYEFAGGDTEWAESGGSRLTLITRVLELTVQHNPITGLGPAAYRPYGMTQPLAYRNTVWLYPRLSSHNNYVDIFAHFGLIGIVMFVWVVFAFGRIGFQLRSRYKEGFTAGYINGMIAAGAASLVIMFLADWILPFVYNIGFPGFQASVLIWLFLGGLVVLEQITPQTSIENTG